MTLQQEHHQHGYILGATCTKGNSKTFYEQVESPKHLARSAGRVMTGMLCESSRVLGRVLGRVLAGVLEYIGTPACAFSRVKMRLLAPLQDA